MYEYLVIEARGHIDDARQALDKYPQEGWRLVQLFLTDGYTTGLIFERPIDTAHGATRPADPYYPRRMRHDGCGGRAGRVELITGIEGASSRPVRKITQIEG